MTISGGRGGQAIEGCLASAIAFSELLIEPYYSYLKHKHMCEWFLIMCYISF